MKDVIQARSTAELLVELLHSPGFIAPNSVVCVALVGKNAVAAFRVDLPRRKLATDYRACASSIVGKLTLTVGVDGVLMLIRTDETFAANEGVPWLDLSRFLATRLRQQEFRVPAFRCLAADAWANYFDMDSPREGRPFSEIPRGPLISEPQRE